MVDAWNDEFSGSGALDAAWLSGNAPINPRRLNGRATFSINADAFTHSSGIYRNFPGGFVPAQVANHDYVTRLDFAGVQGNYCGAGMGVMSPGNGPGASIALWLSSEGGQYFWKVLQMNSYTVFGGEIARSAALDPSVIGGYIRLRTSVALDLSGVSLLQYSVDGRTFTTLYSAVIDYFTLPNFYLVAAPGIGNAIVPSFRFVRRLPLGAPVLAANNFFPLL